MAMGLHSKRAKLRPARALTALLIAAVASLGASMLSGVGAASGAAPTTVIFSGAPGTSAPPSTLGPYTMASFEPDIYPLGAIEDSVDGPTGSVDFSPGLTHCQVGGCWQTWSNGYTGDVYWTGSSTIQLTLPARTQAFYFYAEPNQFQTFSIAATSTDGGSSGPIQVYGDAGAQYFGFYTSGPGYLETITVSCTDPTGFAVGEFGIAVKPLTISAQVYEIPLGSKLSFNANLQVTVSVTNAYGLAVPGAVVTISSSSSVKSSYVTNQYGEVLLTEPVSTVSPNIFSLSLTATYQQDTATTTQEVYSTALVRSCYAIGKPGETGDLLTLLDDLIGNAYANTVVQVAEALFDESQTKYVTLIDESTISVPANPNLYVATFSGSFKTYSLFGTSPVFVPSSPNPIVSGVNCNGFA